MFLLKLNKIDGNFNLLHNRYVMGTVWQRPDKTWVFTPTSNDNDFCEMPKVASRIKDILSILNL